MHDDGFVEGGTDQAERFNERQRAARRVCGSTSSPTLRKSRRRRSNGRAPGYAGRRRWRTSAPRVAPKPRSPRRHRQPAVLSARLARPAGTADASATGCRPDDDRGATSAVEILAAHRAAASAMGAGRRSRDTGSSAVRHEMEFGRPGCQTPANRRRSALDPRPVIWRRVAHRQHQAEQRAAEHAQGGAADHVEREVGADVDASDGHDHCRARSVQRIAERRPNHSQATVARANATAAWPEG